MPPRSWIHGFQVKGSSEIKESQSGIPFFAPDSQALPFPTFSAKTLVIPIVSAANVPQLAVDILIATLSLSRIGTFDPRYLVPVVGGREAGDHGVTTPLELFGKEGVDFLVIQQRSPVLKSRKDEFILSLLKFSEDFGFQSLLFVSGVDLTNRTDSQMHTPIYQIYLPAASAPVAESPLRSLTSLPRYTTGRMMENNTPCMPGGGLTRRILTSIPERWGIGTGFLIWMGMEGDNRTDAVLMAGVLANLVAEQWIQGQFQPSYSHLVWTEKPTDWIEPKSWQQGLFGTPNDQALFG